MKELVSQAIPRTSDLLSDIQSLQSILESKMELYGDNLIQNGLGWKAMGMPVDEQLITTVKGWFYNLCIGLISELDTECSKLQSLVTDMRELLHHPEGDKVIITEIINNLFYSDIITEERVFFGGEVEVVEKTKCVIIRMGSKEKKGVVIYYSYGCSLFASRREGDRSV